MKYRARIDFSFENLSDAQALLAYAKTMQGKVVSYNEGKVNEELSHCDLHRCFHDESPTKPCESMEKIEIKKLPVRAVT